MKEINNNLERFFPKENVIVMLHAHADDESFLSAGIINRFIAHNYNVLLIYLATGFIEEEKRTTIRRKELAEALRFLGVKNVEFLEYCEPKYIEYGKPLFLQSKKDIADEIRTIIEKKGIKHYTLFSYDKNGGYGNKDHLIVHKVGRLLFKNSSPLSSLFEATIPREVYLHWLGKNKNNVPESYLPKLNYWSEEFGLKNEEIDYFYLLDSKQIKLKKEALGKHISQIKNTEFPLSLTNADFIELFGREYFTYVDRSILLDAANVTEVIEQTPSKHRADIVSEESGQCEVFTKCEWTIELPQNAETGASRADANDGEKGDAKPQTVLYSTYKPFS